MVTILFSCIALVVFLVSIDMSWSNLVSAKRNDLIFEGRNHEYGAYALRKEHHVNVFYSLVCSLLFFAGLLFMIYHFSKPAIQKFTESAWILPVLPDMPKPVEDDKPKDSKKAIQQTAASTGGEDNSEVKVVDDNLKQTIKPDLSDKPVGDGPDTGEIQKPFEGGCPDCTGKGIETPTDTFQVVKVETWAPIMPEFPGGENALKKYLGEKVNFSPRDQELGVQGTIYVSFTVSASGGVYDIKIERSIANGERLEEKTVDAIRSMPLWSPGKRGDKNVPVRLMIPMNFKLRN